jgi:hypothetical protein
MELKTLSPTHQVTVVYRTLWAPEGPPGCVWLGPSYQVVSAVKSVLVAAVDVAVDHGYASPR